MPATLRSALASCIVKPRNNIVAARRTLLTAASLQFPRHYFSNSLFYHLPVPEARLGRLSPWPQPLAIETERTQRGPRKYLTAGFHTSRRRNKTVPVHNPPKDGSMLEITPRAAARLASIASRDKTPEMALRIQVESGGCHGFQYTMSLVDLSDAASSNFVGEDDTIFSYVDESPDQNSVSNHEGARIILDAQSLELLKGSKVDFTQELIGSQFKITDNPKASSSCGCGTSFDIKLD